MDSIKTDMALVIVDMQKGFITDKLEQLESNIASLIEKHEFKCILATQFINSKESNFIKLLDWDEMQEGSEGSGICSKLINFKISVFRKYTYGCTELIKFLTENQVRKAIIVGVDTDACILKMALDLFDSDIEPYVLAEYCGSSGGIDYHNSAIKLLQRSIGDSNVIINSLELFKF